jgi:hypothetical protein
MTDEQTDRIVGAIRRLTKVLLYAMVSVAFAILSVGSAIMARVH